MTRGKVEEIDEEIDIKKTPDIDNKVNEGNNIDTVSKEDESPDKSPKPIKGRKLGDEWSNWDGSVKCEEMDSPQGIFLLFASGVTLLFNALMYTLYYFVTPRLDQFHPSLSLIILGLFTVTSAYFIFWNGVLLLTSYTNLKLRFLGRGNRFLLGFLLDKVFALGELIKYNKDKLGNSFVKVANNFTIGTKKHSNKEKLLLLLPRCLTKETYQSIRGISKEYNIEMAVCTGGEIARKKIKEYRPTAVIGVACERDLVSGLKDVGGKVSVLGIPNIRPEGPCKNTFIDMDELKKDIEFYLPEYKK